MPSRAEDIMRGFKLYPFLHLKNNKLFFLAIDGDSVRVRVEK